MSSTIVEIFETHRAKLIGLAYRITGSSFEAEDIAQETFLKWLDAEHDTVRSPYAWLVTVTTRMALDHLKSARVQRGSYPGPWLPEPFVSNKNTPEGERELDESITMALLLLLEQLTPGERASFILHDLFHFNFDEIANILDKSVPSCRKLASRARARIDKKPNRNSTNKDEHAEIVMAFFDAIKKGNMSYLVSLLRDNVKLHADGGGKAPAVKEILQGADAIAAFLLQKITPGFTAGAGVPEISMVWFNGSPGVVLWSNSNPVSAFNFEISGRVIDKIHVLRNPDKLTYFCLHTS